MITHSDYACDNRVTRYAETLAQRGDSVDVLALRGSEMTPREARVRNVRVSSIQNRFDKTKKSKSAFIFPLLRFLVVSSWHVMRRHRSQPYDLLHIHNMPDFMVFAAWYPKLTGTRVILDIHDLLPEFFASKFSTSADSWIVGALRRVEKVSAAFADHVIIANDLFLKTYVSRSAAAEKCSVFLNNVDTSIFKPHTFCRAHNGKPVILFPGGLEWHQGVDIAIHAFSKIQEKLPDSEFHIYGDGAMKPKLVSLVKELGMSGSVRFFKPVGVREIARLMSEADLGVVPKRNDGFGNEAYSTKIMEFMAAGVPVVVSKTKVDSFYFNDSIVRFFESGNVGNMTEAMLDVLSNTDLRGHLVRQASEYVASNCWHCRKKDYLDLVDSLI